ncbi:hypothetical protein NA57DRAFT_75116 [Rhizodiscina lignyota]|uniref:DUF6594 domain-containing protein n=1 Tax=Rhizodiscina lignyota TaxID=1504668 RepID=A0A9P4IHY7_9PEZI|nr:hypothetical protein NA57DRAFT_75116 [Rhizodiscina lignyota]
MSATTPTAVVSSSQTSGADETVPGYPEFAEKMSAIPERTHFRGFRSVSTRLLLYRQARVLKLERELKEIERSDFKSDEGHRSEFSTNSGWLERSAGGRCGQQFNKIKELEEELSNYQRAVLQYHAILQLPDINRIDLSQIQDFLRAKQNVPTAKFIHGPDSRIWGMNDDRDGFAPDLVTLRARYYEDRFSRWIADVVVKHFMGWFDRAPHRRYGEPIVEDSNILWATNYVSTIIASQLPFAFVLALYFVKSMWKRLILLGVSNLVIALALPLFTTARRSDLFAVTIAFFAVQIVFISSTASRM